MRQCAEDVQTQLSQLDARVREALRLLEHRVQLVEHRVLDKATCDPLLEEVQQQQHQPQNPVGHACREPEQSTRDVRGLVDQKLQDVSAKIDEIVADSQEMRARAASQDEQLKMLRALVEA